jgi:molybdopterin/thiamine biosynthesis adenylyltransferase
MFTEQQTERYSRHILLKIFGPRGQARLMTAKVLVIGAGGLGSPALEYLAAAGIGTIGIADHDKVESSNLQRQILYPENAIGSSKTAAACKALKKLNSEVKIIIHNKKIDTSNIFEIIRNYDFILDGTDRLSTKFLINDACIIGKKPFSHAGVVEFGGQIMTIIPGKSACLRCVLGEPATNEKQPSCAQAGVLNAVAGVIGTLQALEAIKFIADSGALLRDAVLFFDGAAMEFRKIKVARDPNCPVCGKDRRGRYSLPFFGGKLK